MKSNIGSVDRVVRILVGLILISLFFVLDSGLKYIGIVGIVLVLTALIRFCPLYPIFVVL